MDNASPVINNQDDEEEEESKDWLVIEEKKEILPVELKQIPEFKDFKVSDPNQSLSKIASLEGEGPRPRLLSDDNLNNKFVKRKYVQPIASVFFRFSHRDKNNHPLTNQE